MDTWLVVGLGNPGPRYAGNRHNVGAMALCELAGRTGSTLRTHKARAVAAQTRIGASAGGAAGGAPAGGAPGPAAVLAVPSCFMNESGGPVSALMRFFSLSPDHLVVLHDDLDISAGEVRLKLGGGEGGHNGLRSVSASIGTKDYYRVRVGIGRPPGRMDAADFVLRDFSVAERKVLPLLLADAVDAVELLVGEGLAAAQQRFHSPS